MPVRLVDMHEWIDNRLSHTEARYQQYVNGRPGIANNDTEFEIDCMDGIKRLLEAVNNDPKVFSYLKAKGLLA